MSAMGIGGAYICHKCGSIMATHEEHSTTVGCFVASQFVSVGPTIWASEEARKIVRYDEAIRLLEECEKVDTDAWAMILTRKVRAFLAAEPADKETT